MVGYSSFMGNTDTVPCAVAVARSAEGATPLGARPQVSGGSAPKDPMGVWLATWALSE
jgi:hypothetical protein